MIFLPLFVIMISLIINTNSDLPSTLLLLVDDTPSIFVKVVRMHQQQEFVLKFMSHFPNGLVIKQVCKRKYFIILYVQEVVTQPEILNRTILNNLVHVTYNYFAL